jgi:hypothetical protein
MKNFLTQNFRYIIYGVIAILGFYLISVLMNPKTDMNELDKYKLDQLNQSIKDITETQKKLDSTIQNYNQELLKIDSTISLVKNQKTIIKEYYKEKGEEIDGMTITQLDSLFHKRYKY